MSCAQASSIVAMEIFMEMDVVAEVGVFLHSRVGARHRAASVGTAQEDPLQAIEQLKTVLEELQQIADSLPV